MSNYFNNTGSLRGDSSLNPDLYIRISELRSDRSEMESRLYVLEHSDYIKRLILSCKEADE